MPKLLLKVVEAKEETPTIKSVKLGLDGNALGFQPGQYCLFWLETSEGMQSHSFSIACAPGRGYLEFATRKSESAFKQAFWQLKEGDEVSVQGPAGRFVYDEAIGHAVMLSGGIGITPLESMLEYASDKKLANKITLLFSNRALQEIPFRKELDEIAGGNENIKVVYTLSELQPGEEWGGERGRVNEEMVRKHVEDIASATYFICGPPAMVEGLKQTLAQMGVGDESVRIENFAGYK